MLFRLPNDLILNVLQNWFVCDIKVYGLMCIAWTCDFNGGIITEELMKLLKLSINLREVAKRKSYHSLVNNFLNKYKISITSVTMHNTCFKYFRYAILNSVHTLKILYNSSNTSKMSYCVLMTSSPFLANQILNCIHNCVNLTYLSFEGYQHFVGEEITYHVFKSMKKCTLSKLQQIDISSDMSYVTGILIHDFYTSQDNQLVFLKMISVSLDDKKIINLIKKCPLLRKLAVGCFLHSDEVFTTIMEHCPGITQLKLGSYLTGYVTMETVAELINQCLHLEEFHLFSTADYKDVGNGPYELTHEECCSAREPWSFCTIHYSNTCSGFGLNKQLRIVKLAGCSQQNGLQFLTQLNAGSFEVMDLKGCYVVRDYDRDFLEGFIRLLTDKFNVECAMYNGLKHIYVNCSLLSVDLKTVYRVDKHGENYDDDFIVKH